MGLADELDEMKRVEQAQAKARRQAEEEDQQQARAMLLDFVATCRQRGVKPNPVRTYYRDTTFRTTFVGWEIGHWVVGEDGELYTQVLHERPGFLGSQNPVRVTPRTIEYEGAHDFTYSLKSELLNYLKTRTG